MAQPVSSANPAYCGIVPAAAQEPVVLKSTNSSIKNYKIQFDDQKQTVEIDERLLKELKTYSPVIRGLQFDNNHISKASPELQKIDVRIFKLFIEVMTNFGFIIMSEDALKYWYENKKLNTADASLFSVLTDLLACPRYKQIIDRSIMYQAVSFHRDGKYTDLSNLLHDVKKAELIGLLNTIIESKDVCHVINYEQNLLEYLIIKNKTPELESKLVNLAEAELDKTFKQLGTEQKLFNVAFNRFIEVYRALLENFNNKPRNTDIERLSKLIQHLIQFANRSQYLDCMAKIRTITEFKHQIDNNSWLNLDLTGFEQSWGWILKSKGIDPERLAALAGLNIGQITLREDAALDEWTQQRLFHVTFVRTKTEPTN